MPCRKDRQPWSEAEDKWLAEHAANGIPVPKQHAVWPKIFPPRTLSALRMRRAQLGITTTVNPEVEQRGVKQPPPVEELQKVETREVGDELVVTTVGQEVRTLDELIARARVDLTRYEVDRPETSMWETTIRDHDGNVRKVQNFRIVARFRLKAGPTTAEQVQALIDGAFQKRPPVQQKLKLSKTAQSSELLQAIVIADPHLAKYAWARETGHSDYDLDIASQLVDTAATELMGWGDETRPAVRHIWLLGDVLHYDNPQGHTTGGTPQDRDTRLGRMLSKASSVLCGIIERSAASCPTVVTMVAGNHDRTLTIAMQLILAAHFRRDERVVVDVEPTHRKYIEWGHCLLGLTHGDTARKRLAGLMQVERKEAWGRSRVREWHHGHFHREAQTVTDGGVTIREHLSLSPPDSWHAVEGYVGAPRGMDSFLYAKDGYLRGTWRSPVLSG